MRFLLCFFLLLLPGIAVAQESDRSRELKETKSRLAESKVRADKLKKNLSEMENHLESVQKESGELAAELQENEQQLHELETQLEGLKKAEAEKQGQIVQHRSEIGAMLASAIRMQQIPPHAVFAMEGGLVTHVHASRTLAMTSGSLKERLDLLGQEITEIAHLREEIGLQTASLEAKEIELSDRRKALAESLGERRRMVRALHEEDRKEQQQIVTLTRKSQNLASLVDALEAERKRQIAEETKKEAAAKVAAAVEIDRAKAEKTPAKKVTLPKRKSSRKEYNLASAKGKLRLPVAGSLSGGYGKQRGANDTLRGIEIDTSGGGVVTAPYGGEVLFTGPFLDYGRMVIIRHSRQYHTLLAGLARIDVSPGQFLLEGEPIGVMGNAKAERRLYVELRENGKPIDPAPWFGSALRLARR